MAVQPNPPAMLIAAIIVGGLGGSIGLTLGVFVYGLVAIGGDSSARMLQFVSMAIPVACLVGAGIAWARPVIGAVLMLGSAVGLLLYFGVNSFTAIPLILSGLGGTLALVASGKARSEVAVEYGQGLAAPTRTAARPSLEGLEAIAAARANLDKGGADIAVQANRPTAPPRREMQEFEKVLDRSATDVAAFEESQRSLLQTIQHFLHGNPTIVPVIVLVVSVLIFGAIANNFLTSFNLSLIIGQVTIIGILGIAQTLIILTAGIDLSVAAIMMLASVVMGGLAVSAGLPAFVAIPIGLVVGGLCGLFNGALVAKLKLPPFIVTLGSWSIFFALLLWLSGGESIRSQDIDAQAPLLKIFGERVGFLGAQFTTGSILMVILFAIFWYVLNHTPWGRHVYAVGDDALSAQLAGIRVDKVLISVYATAGVLCGLAGWAAIGRVGSVSPQSFYEGNLDAITAVVIGGTSLFGGRGSIFGTLVGALIVGVFRSGLNLTGVDVLWQQFAVGALIIIAVATDQWLRKVSG